MTIWDQHLRLLDTEGLLGVSGEVGGPSDPPCAVPVSDGIVDEASEPPSVILVAVVGSDGVVNPSVILPANDMKKENKNNISDVTLYLNSAHLIKKLQFCSRQIVKLMPVRKIYMLL